MKHKNLYIIISLVLILFASCSGNSGSSSATNDPGEFTLMVLPEELSAVSSSMTSTLTVYSTTVTQIYHKSLSFTTDADGNDIVQSQALTLKQGNHYRFVVVFYWNNSVFAYVDMVRQIDNDSNTEIEFTTTDIVYDTENPNSSVSLPMLYDQGSEDLNIKNLTVYQSETDGSIAFNAEITSDDTALDVSLVLSENDNVFLVRDLSEDLISAGERHTFNISVDADNFTSDDFELKLIVTDSLGQTSSLTTDVEIN